MLDVGGWYWALADELRYRGHGWIGDPPSAGRATLLEVLQGSQYEAQREAAERERQRSEMRRRTASLARGGS